MKHLSGVDASFLHLETPEMPMHVGSLNIFDLPEGYNGDFYEDVKAHIAGRMHLAEVFERKLAQMPFELSEPGVGRRQRRRLDYHIRRVVLSKPGTFRQLEQLVGRLHSSLLDRSRPLWEFYVIEGLQTGQPAIYAKVHHAAVDGQAGVALAKAIYDLTPEPRPIKPPRARQRGNQYQLGVAELATRGDAEHHAAVHQAVHHAARTPCGDGQRRRCPKFGGRQSTQLRAADQLDARARRRRSTCRSPTSARSPPARCRWPRSSRSPRRADVTAQRCRAGRQRRRAAALPRRLQLQLPDRSLDRRRAGEPARGRQYRPQQPGVDDAGEPRHRHRRSARAAEDDQRLEQGGQGADGQPQGGDPDRLPLVRRALDHGRASRCCSAARGSPTDLPPVANVAISNVPGAPVPLYMAGAKLATYYPVSIPAHGVALNITVQSYNGSLDYGLTACRRAVPDVDDLADYLVEAHAELTQPGSRRRRPPPRSRRRRRRRVARRASSCCEGACRGAAEPGQAPPSRQRQGCQARQRRSRLRRNQGAQRTPTVQRPQSRRRKRPRQSGDARLPSKADANQGGGALLPRRRQARPRTKR